MWNSSPSFAHTCGTLHDSPTSTDFHPFPVASIAFMESVTQGKHDGASTFSIIEDVPTFINHILIPFKLI